MAAQDREEKNESSRQNEQNSESEKSIEATLSAETLDEESLKAIQFITDLPLKLTAELGRINLTIRDILSLAKGTVIELEKLAGEPLDIYVNGRAICRGEVVVSGEKYGIRMTDIIDPVDNIEMKKG